MKQITRTRVGAVLCVLVISGCSSRKVVALQDTARTSPRADSQPSPPEARVNLQESYTPPPTILRFSGRLRDLVKNLARVGVQSTPYKAPSTGELAIAREGFKHLVYLQVALAAQDLARIGLELLRLDEGGVVYYVVRENQQQPIRGWGFFVLNSRARRPYVLEVPHPRYDRLTDKQGIQLMTSLGARALLLSTTYRCATRTASDCEGQTTACGKGRRYHPYNISDMAHTTRSLFQVAHEVFFTHTSDSLFLQFHGFDRRPGRIYHVVVSDGTRLSGGARIFSNRLASLLQKEISDPLAAVSCNRWHRRRVPLCGTQNVQGRFANGSPDPCRVAAMQSSNRYIHIEQSWDARTSGGDITAQALLRALRQLVKPTVWTPVRRTLPWMPGTYTVPW